MEMENRLVNGFSKDDEEKITRHLERLLPYINTEKAIIVGGLTIRYYITQAGLSYPNRPFNDIDMVVTDSSVVSPKVTSDFLVSHHHPPRNGNSFYLVLIDSPTRTKIDMFTNPDAFEGTQRIEFENHTLRMQSIEMQLVHTVLSLQRISENVKVDPKQFQDARLLMKIVDLKKAEKIWKEKNMPFPFLDALQRAEKIAADHPEWIRIKPFHKEKPYICTGCVSTKEFPLTPMEDIYKMLGYYE